MDKWYYLEDGKQAGPVDESALEKMIAEGTLKPSDLIWKDSLDNWVSVSEMLDEGAAPAAGDDEAWFYLSGGEQIGPFTRSGLGSLVENLSVKQSDMVWNESMAGWSPVSKVPLLSDFKPQVKLAAPPKAPKKEKKPTTAAGRLAQRQRAAQQARETAGESMVLQKEQRSKTVDEEAEEPEAFVSGRLIEKRDVRRAFMPLVKIRWALMTMGVMFFIQAGFIAFGLVMVLITTAMGDVTQMDVFGFFGMLLVVLLYLILVFVLIRMALRCVRAFKMLGILKHSEDLDDLRLANLEVAGYFRLVATLIVAGLVIMLVMFIITVVLGSALAIFPG